MPELTRPQRRPARKRTGNRPAVVLVSELESHLELVCRLGEVGRYEPDLGRLQREDCVFDVDVSGDVLTEYKEAETAQFAQLLGQFHAVLLGYDEGAEARTLLRDLLPGLEGILDAGGSKLLGYEEVLIRFHDDPAWDLGT
ncbi:hypothetical protein SAMN05421504_11617 [Amycolatopsis xylanica]|uniref:Uncharacterized protein n=1 Tax=Amycolatopsis xylanica TaxID=589385 RepID=A0A1H3SXN7_9PSEU|nr:hypothetical protein [Amycolatopsis xylanica]SDZ42265.1 hypothetical protein SAMN05421504_11617 [Amycolatopsis xylanica]